MCIRDRCWTEPASKTLHAAPEGAASSTRDRTRPWSRGQCVVSGTRETPAITALITSISAGQSPAASPGSNSKSGCRRFESAQAHSVLVLVRAMTRWLRHRRRGCRSVALRQVEGRDDVDDTAQGAQPNERASVVTSRQLDDRSRTNQRDQHHAGDGRCLELDHRPVSYTHLTLPTTTLC